MRGLVLAVALAFVLAPRAEAATWTVKGAGFGHGVGMSAWGAYGYGKHGATGREILDHYYRDIEVTELDGTRRVRVLLKTARGSVSFSGATKACGRRLKAGTTYRAKRSGGAITRRRCRLRHAPSCHRPRAAVDLRPRRVPRGAGGRARRRRHQRRQPGRGQRLRPRLARRRAVPELAGGRRWRRSPSPSGRSRCPPTSGGTGFALYPDTRTQLYKGVAVETDRTDRAVEATRGEVATYDGAIAQTTYFSSSGGGPSRSSSAAPGPLHPQRARTPTTTTHPCTAGSCASPRRRSTPAWRATSRDACAGSRCSSAATRRASSARGSSARGGKSAVSGDTLPPRSASTTAGRTSATQADQARLGRCRAAGPTDRPVRTAGGGEAAPSGASGGRGSRRSGRPRRGTPRAAPRRSGWARAR